MVKDHMEHMDGFVLYGGYQKEWKAFLIQQRFIAWPESDLDFVSVFTELP